MKKEPESFSELFCHITGHSPFPWQERLYSEYLALGNTPKACSLPTGLGKTSVIAIWLIALANGAAVPRRLIYVVNRRTVVDQTTAEVEHYKSVIDSASKLSSFKAQFESLRISTLRGQYADNGDWCENPSRPAVIVGTVDMIGSRLLFSGYGIGRAKRPLHAGFLGQDALLIHDEAHLEPAFQRLIETIEMHQRDYEPKVQWPKLKVMELTATSKSANPFKLDHNDYANIIVDRRMNAVKQLHLHELLDSKKPAKELAHKALSLKSSGRAIVVFASSVESVLEVQATLEKANLPVKSLTGTLRGKERDKLVIDKTFARFLPATPDNATTGTVYLVCTSAGEVGVNISADSMICDLTTIESMAQRLGRVNRFGNVEECEVHVYVPTTWDEKNPLTIPRQRTLALLHDLNGNASPKALGDLPAEARNIAFSPNPAFLPVTETLFDAWALTTITGKLPGRPAVEAYLHGLIENEIPETHVAWREDVQLLSRDELDDRDRSDLLLAYPLLPHELLREPSYRVIKHLEAIAQRHPNHHAWLVNDDGEVKVVTLEFFTDRNNKERINGMTVVLDPRSGGIKSGIMDGTCELADDVSKTDDRCRSRDTDPTPPDFHVVYSFTIPASDDDEDPEVLRWFVRRNTGEIQSKKPVLLEVHVSDVEKRMTDIISGMSLGSSIDRCLTIAAKYHDQGKKRRNFQMMLGNRNSPKVWWAKSGYSKGIPLEEKYRHEFGSLHELFKVTELGLTGDERELVLHLIAAHHGRARPNFPADEVFDPNSTNELDKQLAISVPQRFGRLQRKFGRWGLAYLESLLRAADWSASANPSKEVG